MFTHTRESRENREGTEELGTNTAELSIEIGEVQHAAKGWCDGEQTWRKKESSMVG